jgi:ABC-type uncharacterized transport system substrate-binding protein
MHLRSWVTIGLMLLPAPALAHPHVFISAGIEVLFDAEGQAYGVRVSWTYDELFSLMILEDRGMDQDFDGVLTAAETSDLAGFDMQWDADFPGDTYALLGDAPLALGRPEDFATSFADSMLTSVHTRRFAAPVAVADLPLVIQSYDPSFYTAYTIDAEPKLSGAGDCVAQTFEPDRDLADAKLAQLMEEYSGADLEAGAFPAVGAAYADEVRVTCAARS